MDAIKKAININLLVGRMMPVLNEVQRRYLLGALSDDIGRGSITFLSELTGYSRNTIMKGKQEVTKLPVDATARPDASSLTQIRHEGGGRKKTETLYQNVIDSLQRLLDGYTIGNPEKNIYWTTKSFLNFSKNGERVFHLSESFDRL